MKYYLKCLIFFLSLTAIINGCQSNVNPLNSNETVILYNAVNEIDEIQVAIFYDKIRSLSNATRIYSRSEQIKALEAYKDIYNWIINDVENFPLLFLYIINDKRINDNEDMALLISEDMANTVVLLWDLAENIYPDVVVDMWNSEDYSHVHLISRILMMNNT